MNTMPTKEEMLKYWTSKVEQMTQHTSKGSNHGEDISHAIELKETQKILFNLTTGGN